MKFKKATLGTRLSLEKKIFFSWESLVPRVKKPFSHSLHIRLISALVEHANKVDKVPNAKSANSRIYQASLWKDVQNLLVEYIALLHHGHNNGCTITLFDNKICRTMFLFINLKILIIIHSSFNAANLLKESVVTSNTSSRNFGNSTFKYIEILRIKEFIVTKWFIAGLWLFLVILRAQKAITTGFGFRVQQILPYLTSL